MHKRSAHRSLLVVGSVALDDIDGPFGFHRDLLGGSASFIARAASYFTRNVSIVAVVGDDFPKRHLDELDELGVDTTGIERSPARRFTGSAHAPDPRDGESRHAPAPAEAGGVHASRAVLLGNIDPQLDVVRRRRG
jgi:sugar/nucleoside kinase (ribokinase family)